jgi:ABC-type antimicrobial peptide transport system permease subunit
MRGYIDPVSLAPMVRQAISGTEPRLVIKRIASVGQLLDDALARERFAAALASLFGIVALALAAIGVYGVIANGVARRTAEIGIRMALGATPADALWLVMRQTLAIAGLGLAIGLPLAMAAGRAVESQLYDVGASDPRVVAFAVLALAAAAVTAGLVPARRAANVDPAVALRAE